MDLIEPIFPFQFSVSLIRRASQTHTSFVRMLNIKNTSNAGTLSFYISSSWFHLFLIILPYFCYLFSVFNPVSTHIYWHRLVLFNGHFNTYSYLVFLETLRENVTFYRLILRLPLENYFRSECKEANKQLSLLKKILVVTFVLSEL